MRRLPQYRSGAKRAEAERAACPHINNHQAAAWANRAGEDALDLISDVHDIDPRELWGRLVLWGRHDPPRLVAAVVALAAMHNPDSSRGALTANIHAVAVTSDEDAA